MGRRGKKNFKKIVRDQGPWDKKREMGQSRLGQTGIQ